MISGLSLNPIYFSLKALMSGLLTIIVKLLLITLSVVLKNTSLGHPSNKNMLTFLGVPQQSEVHFSKRTDHIKYKEKLPTNLNSSAPTMQTMFHFPLGCVTFTTISSGPQKTKNIQIGGLKTNIFRT